MLEIKHEEVTLESTPFKHFDYYVNTYIPNQNIYCSFTNLRFLSDTFRNIHGNNNIVIKNLHIKLTILFINNSPNYIPRYLSTFRKDYLNYSHLISLYKWVVIYLSLLIKISFSRNIPRFKSFMMYDYMNKVV